MSTLKNRHILITGASSGLGKELSIHFDTKVKSLTCMGKNNKKMKLLKNNLKNKKHSYYSGDMSIDKNLKSFLKFLNKIKKIDTIIHCMGGGLGLRDNLINKKDFIKLFMVNLIAQSEINNLLIKKMIKNKIKGNILHVSSVAALESIGSIGYSCAKAALSIYSKKLAKAFVKENIFIKTIIPGAFETSDNSFARLKKKNLNVYKKFRNTRLPRKKYAEAKDIIPVVEFLISNKAEMLSGTDVVTDFSELNSFRN
jgi:short-subunit dehydrogenase